MRRWGVGEEERLRAGVGELFCVLERVTEQDGCAVALPLPCAPQEVRAGAGWAEVKLKKVGPTN